MGANPSSSNTKSDVKSGVLEDVNYNIGYSGLGRPYVNCVLDRVTISAGKFVSGGASIAVGVRESPIYLSRDNYRDRMRWVSGQYVIL